MALGDQTAPVPFKQGDTLPTLRYTMTQGGGLVDLTGATVVFNMRKSVNPFTVKVNRGAATIVSAAQGIVEYAWGSSDLNTNDTYQSEFEVTFPSGKVLTWPSTTDPATDYIWIVVTDDIA